MSNIINRIKTLNNNINYIRKIKENIQNNFQVIINDNSIFLIYLKSLEQYTKNILNYNNLLIEFKKINGNKKVLFVLIYNKKQYIELYDNVTLIMTNKNPEIFMSDFKQNVINLEGLRYIAHKLQINLVNDKRKENDVKNLPYTKLKELNNEYYIYQKIFKVYNKDLEKAESYLLKNNKRIYFFYFKKELEEIRYIEKNENYYVIIYPENKKEEFINFVKNNIKEKE